ncbi:DUF2381 family protein [Corallococcus sp. bb12-1]|uniref:DUF2381 family protein n=1 Tax=Corallococcus sp. bb12-1 TaxID=2996784 RepID=UPI0022701F32|nr:DUF2381 family protein [Corallococcus sp. bb12-1]MCY1045081.1 DUF2381 family protein [Corallococcus sp. bb12-1]
MRVSWAIFLGFLLVSRRADAEPETSVQGPGVRRIELMPDDAGGPHEVRVSPGLSTMLLFDSELIQEGFELEGRDRFSLVDAGRTTVRLIPSQKVSAQDQFRLIVRFRDGLAPGSVSLLLRVHPAKAETLVEVFRQKRTLETYQQEAREARAETLRCQEDHARLLGELTMPGGLVGLISTKGMDEKGVAGQDLTKAGFQAEGRGLEVVSLRLYRSTERVAVEGWIAVPTGSRTWTAKGAVIRGRNGEELKVLRVWQQGPILPGSNDRIIVEAKAPSGSNPGPFALKLWEEDGPRSLTISKLMFP